MGLIAFAVLGLLVGMLARALMSPDDPGGVLFTMVIGMVGGLAGGVFTSMIVGMNPLTEFWDALAMVGAFAGSIVLLTVYLLISSEPTG